MERAVSKRTRAKKAAQRGASFTRFEVIDFILSLSAFFMGRVLVFKDVAPLSIAYVSLFLNRDKKLYIAGAFVLVGILTKIPISSALNYILCVAVLALINFFIKSLKINKTETAGAAICAAAICASGLFIAFLSVNPVYFSLMAILEGVLTFSLSLIMSKGLALTRMYSPQRKLTNEELISLVVLVGGFIAGMADIYIGDVALRYCFSAFVITLFAYRGGAAIGATAGLALGVMLRISGFEGLEFVIVMAISGFCAGSFSELHRFFSAVAFVVSSVLAGFLLSGRLVDAGYLFSVMLSASAFILAPEKYFNMLSETLNPTVNNGKAYAEKIKEIARYRLDSTASAFERLAKDINGAAVKKTEELTKDNSKLINDIISESCENCGNKALCWQENYYSSYQAVCGMLAACEKKRSVAGEDISPWFYERCADVKRFVSATLDNYELYRADCGVSAIAEESKRLVADQFMSVSAIMANLSEELDFEASFNEDIEKALVNELLTHKLEIGSLSVNQTAEGRYEVTVSHKPYREGRSCHKRIAATASEILGRKMCCEENECAPKKSAKGYFCTARFVEREELKVVCGAAAMTKSSEKESGDTASYGEVKKGVYLLALSDGMGSGKIARRESETAIGLIESFTRAGFEKEAAIKLINSAMAIKSEDDLFSTLDICSLDLYKREAEFIKVGAAPSYILRNGQVAVIKSFTLPVGILPGVSVEPVKKSIKEGDVIVMATDGLTELGQTPKDGEEDWLIEAIREYGDCAPQDLADILMRQAKKRSKSVIADDMTALVARVY